ncbi:MAG: PASTA domain-containing protein [Vicinamibacteria bacterium]|nr:PASTA domain-containing protein [Vicinamibacteria bacterium]
MMLRRLLVVTLALLCGLISAALTLRIVRNSQTVAVPNLTGRSLANATNDAGQRRLRVKVTGRKNHAKIGAGRVIEQDPLPGVATKENRTLRVVLSLGPRRTTVPDVQGQALRSARLRLDGMGVPIRRIIEAPSAAADDTVLAQSPEAGIAENLGDGVLLIVARNGSLRDYVMPDLIGKDISVVAEAFEGRGFVPPQIRYKSYPGLVRGTILSQSPLAGYRLNPKTAVIFEVSEGA